MTLRSALLRVMLIVALILNGAGTAAASVILMPGASPDSVSTGQTRSHPMTVAMLSSSPCHDMAQMTAERSSSNTVGALPAEQAQKTKHSTPDCCKSSVCRCACTQAVAAALMTVAAFGVGPLHSDVVRPLSLRHADPTLPHLVRPPIG